MPQEVSYKKVALDTCIGLSFQKIAGSVTYSKQTPTQVFSCEYFEIFKNTYFEEHLRKTAFVSVILFKKLRKFEKLFSSFAWFFRGSKS